MSANKTKKLDLTAVRNNEEQLLSFTSQTIWSTKGSVDFDFEGKLNYQADWETGTDDEDEYIIPIVIFTNIIRSELKKGDWKSVTLDCMVVIDSEGNTYADDDLSEPITPCTNAPLQKHDNGDIAIFEDHFAASAYDIINNEEQVTKEEIKK